MSAQTKLTDPVNISFLIDLDEFENELTVLDLKKQIEIEIRSNAPKEFESGDIDSYSSKILVNARFKVD